MPATPIKNGADYAQNYDIIVKWMAAALKGETLEVLGLKTGRIEEVFGFEPVELAVKAGRVDLIVRDENGDLYHIEEQRNLSRADMYRFASQHFTAAAQWGHKITDVILASGNSEVSTHNLTTLSGHYEPTIIDFATRDGRKRLAEIRQAVASGDPVNLIELVFLPLYGRERGNARIDLAEQVVRFEIDLFKKKQFSDKLLAATLIMSNKLLGKERINELWEEIKMLDIIEVALEKGEETGFKKGEETGFKKGKDEGEVTGIQKMLMTLLMEKFSPIPRHIAVQIKKIQDSDVLQSLCRVILRCEDLSEFEAALNRV
jgi:hypothetical protein